MIDEKAIAGHIRGILEALGDDPDREGLRETPQRVAKMYSQVFAGMNYTNQEIAQMFSKTFESAGSQDLVVVRDIDVFSYCEHHLALMYDMKVSVAYFPIDRVIGLSKIARIADMAARRLQLQERLGRDIAEIISLVTESPDVAVVISGCHSCMTARGIQKPGTQTITETYRGRFQSDPMLQLRMEALLK
jgi:GTP cyclohydrolase I